MKLSRTPAGVRVELDGVARLIDEEWDALINRDGLLLHLTETFPSLTDAPAGGVCLAPIGSQEVWAAGVTYFRSRTARIEESQDSGGGSFYDRVYDAARPELFFKAAPWRVRGTGDLIRVRRDSKWSVPEPEFALYVNSRGEIIGYTIGNDVSSRDIEGENPLYLPQAKTYDGSCSLGPSVLLVDEPLGADTAISILIERGGVSVFDGSTTLAQMRRTPRELVDYLFRETSFPQGCVLLTGTGVVPPDSFTLASGDRVAISVAEIGTLDNTVE
ncbi:MAG: fumarylacetoacetate hydrolase family protein [Gemmatimonadota bacterium]